MASTSTTFDDKLRALTAVKDAGLISVVDFAMEVEKLRQQQQQEQQQEAQRRVQWDDVVSYVYDWSGMYEERVAGRVFRVTIGARQDARANTSAEKKLKIFEKFRGIV